MDFVSMLITGNFEDTNYVCGSGLPGIMFVEKKVIKKCFFFKESYEHYKTFFVHDFKAK